MLPITKSHPSRWSRGELAIAAAIGLLALAIAWPGCRTIHARRQLAMVRHDIATLERALVRYFREYGAWPVPPSVSPGDAHFGGLRSNSEIVRVLRAKMAPGDPEDALNPQRIVFFDADSYRPGASGLDEDGSFLDPWGTPYQIALDGDYDNAVTPSHGSTERILGSGVAIRSFGPDRLPDTADDLRSWKQGADERVRADAGITWE